MNEAKRDTALNIFQRIAAITAELNVVPKNLTVSTSGNKGYNAVSERDIIDSVKPLEAKYGVYSYPASRTVLENDILESESTYNGNTTKKTTFFERIETIYRFVNIDKPEEAVETTTFAVGLDTQDKGSGKAMTYADKYALMKMYKISTGEDLDANPSKDDLYRKPEKKPAAKPKEEMLFRCEQCNTPIGDYPDAKGVNISKRKWAEGTKLKFGKVLCKGCYEALKANENQ